MSASKASHELLSELENLSARFERGAISDSEYWRSRDETIGRIAPKMSDEELTALAIHFDRMLSAIKVELASRGLSAPGKNPEKPN